MTAEDPSELVAHPSTDIPHAPLLAPRSLFSFRTSALLAATRDHGGEIPDSDDLKLLRARYRQHQPILHDRLSKLTPARRRAALTISTTAATCPASAGLQSMGGSSMSEATPNDSQVSICTTVSTASPSSDSSSSGVDLRPAFDLRAGFALKEEKGKKSPESEHEREHHRSNKDGYHDEVDRSGRFAASEDSFSEVSQPCSEATRESQDGRPRGVRQALSRVSASFKRKLHKLWPEDDPEHAQLRWIHLPTDEHDDNNPFYQVRYGVQFQSLVPQPPARFPYASQIAYASRYGSAVTIDPSDRADLREEERLRERQNRRALLRRRSTAGRFRRRPNITLPPTEGRITEPVEVARIRRAYGGTLASNTHQRSEDGDSKSLLERMNRQVRTGTQEWTLTGVEHQPHQQPPVPTTANILPGGITRIAVSDANQKIASRRSVNRAVSTRAPGRPVRREDLHRSQSLFSTQWEAYQRRKLTSRRDSNALGSGSRDPVCKDDLSFAQDLTARLEQVVAADQSVESSTGVSMPVLVVTPCAGPDPATTLCDNSSGLVPEIKEPTTSFLMAPRAGSRGEERERRWRRGSSSPYASDHEVESDNISVRVRSSRSSVHSVSSHISAASSIANSIYSTLSEDWIRPPYYAPSRSARYPLSLQRSIRTLPPHIVIGVRRRSELSSDVKTLAEATRLAKQIRTRGLRDYDGNMIRPDVGDQLHTVEFSVVYKPIEGAGVAMEEEEQDCKEHRNPALLFMDPCKSALPLTADSMGFVEYGSDDEDVEFTGDGSERVGAVAAGEAEKRVVLDVNDTSAMVAMRINPLDPHPDPLAFYNTHFAYFQKHGCFLGDDDRSDPSFQDVGVKGPWNARKQYGGQNNFQEGEEEEEEEEEDGMGPAHAQLLKGDASLPPSPTALPFREPPSRRKTVLKKAYARVRSLWSSNDLPPVTTTTTTFPLPTSRFQVCSRAKIAPETRSTVAAMDGRGCGVEGDQDWIARLPSGARTLGQFDRDWLDAMPPLSRDRVRSLSPRRN